VLETISDGYPVCQGVWTKKISAGYDAPMSEESRKHSQGVLLRFEPGQLDMIDRAAELAGLNRTSWLRLTVLRVAREELGEGGKGKRKTRP
jgi:hypothetical protein